jgi:predicted transcriptional regulator
MPITLREEPSMATVRVEPQLHEKLRELSSAERRPISQVIEEAIDRYEKDKFWTAMHEGFARLRADPEAWADYQSEAALWDSASNDGLENEEPYFTEPDTNR